MSHHETPTAHTHLLGGQQESRPLYIWDLSVAEGVYHGVGVLLLFTTEPNPLTVYHVLLLSALNTNHTHLSHIVCIYAFQALIN